jgi:hypothetical protein
MMSSMDDADERDNEVGAESADLSPAAVAAEAERLRILREREIVLEDWRDKDGDDG